MTRSSSIQISDDVQLFATFERHPPEPDAGFMHERFECRKLIVRLDWQGRPDAKFPASKWRSHEMELTGEDFGAWLSCYEEKLLAELPDVGPVFDEDPPRTGRA